MWQVYEISLIVFNFSGYLTIGIPSVKRDNGIIYLSNTLKSLVAGSSTKQKELMVVVVFLADFDRDYNREAVKNLTRQFEEYVHMGFIQVRHVLVLSRIFVPLGCQNSQTFALLSS